MASREEGAAAEPRPGSESASMPDVNGNRNNSVEAGADDRGEDVGGGGGDDDDRRERLPDSADAAGKERGDSDDNTSALPPITRSGHKDEGDGDSSDSSDSDDDDDNGHDAGDARRWRGTNLLRSRSPRPLVDGDPFLHNTGGGARFGADDPSRLLLPPSAASHSWPPKKKSESLSPTRRQQQQQQQRARRVVRWRAEGEDGDLMREDAEARMQNRFFPGGGHVRMWCDPKRAPNVNAGYVLPSRELTQERVLTVSFGSSPRFADPPKHRTHPAAHKVLARSHSWAAGGSGSGSGSGSGGLYGDGIGDDDGRPSVGFSHTARTSPLLWAPPYLKGGEYVVVHCVVIIIIIIIALLAVKKGSSYSPVRPLHACTGGDDAAGHICSPEMCCCCR
jgi:hypothetical protein